jgi:hypothetical protein
MALYRSKRFENIRGETGDYITLGLDDVRDCTEFPRYKAELGIYFTKSASSCSHGGIPIRKLRKIKNMNRNGFLSAFAAALSKAMMKAKRL